jgi:hypothetical protein
MSISIPSLAGPRDSGGGDNCELRIQEIRDDILSWIQKGGPQGFQALPVSVTEYSSRMREYLLTVREPNGAIRPKTSIECVHHAIEVQGVEKTCRFDQLAQGPKITCQAESFMDKSKMTADEQYQLVHHEYAGLAGLEVPSDSQSNYIYSSQLSAFLENQVVRKLVVKPGSELNPEIVQLRDEFLSGKTPSPDDLKIGSRWNCAFLSTEKDNFYWNNMPIWFLRNQYQFYAITRNSESSSNTQIMDFGMMDIIPERGLYGTYTGGSNYNKFTAIRQNKAGDLVIECAGDLVSFSGPDIGGYKKRFDDAPGAILGRPHKALNYGRCTLER